MLPLRNPVFRRLMGYALSYKPFLFVSFFGFALFAAAESLLTRIITYFFNYLENKPSEPLPFISDEFLASIYFVPSAVVVLGVFRGIGFYLGNFYISRVGLNVVNTLRKQIFAHALYLPQSYYDTRNTGELVSIIIFNVEQITQSVTDSIKIFLNDGLLLLSFIGVMLYLNWMLTLIFIAITPVLGGIIVVTSRYFLKKSRRIQDSVGQISHISTQSIQGIKLVKSFLGENKENKRFIDAADENLNLQTKFHRAKAAQTPVLHIVIAIALAVIFFLVMQFWPPEDAGNAVAYMTLAGLVAKPARSLASLNAVIQRGVAAGESIFALLDEARELDAGKHTLENVRGEIEFHQVDFRYGDSTELTLKNFNLKINAGETVALVGATGSGKSTIASLLLRFYSPESGQIRIDGHPIDTIQMDSLRSQIALVNQQTILFNDSIRANIAYGESLESASKEEVKNAAASADARHFIEALESGFDTLAGEDGGSLSGGQRQRIAIARALLKDAPILVLDEATSALDNESEKHIQHALESLQKGRTTLVIAHRLSTIERADRIVVLDHGEIVEQGNHETLMKTGGYYARLRSHDQPV